MTWPILPGLARDVPGDLGDSLLNLWILAWGAEHLSRVATGAMSVADFWNANIFHPEPLALGLSEHLFGQVLQILLIYYLTANPILCYNLLFLSSFVLSGLGMYLLVHDLLDEAPGFSLPAFVAGLAFAFLPFRIAQLPHIQMVSSQWMPFALYGFRRFIRRPADAPADRRRVGATSYWPLIGGAAALLMQNWSCGYYLIYFSPFVLLFVIHQIVAAGRVRDLKLWTAFAVAGAIVFAGTWPFLSLYLDTQRVHGFARSRGEVIGFSADVYGYFTASEWLRLWGPILRVTPKAEGEVFLGFVPMLLAVIAVVAALWNLATRPQSTSQPANRWMRYAVTALVAIAAIQLTAFFVVLFTAGFVTSVAGLPIRASSAGRLLLQAAVALAIAGALSRDVRDRLARALVSPVLWTAALTVLAMVLSLGPAPMSRGLPISGLGLYSTLYDSVPGFNGLRVPARAAMVASVFLSILAGYGAAVVGRNARHGRGILIAAAVVFIAEAWAAPLPVNLTWGGDAVPPDRIYTAADAPPVYRAVGDLPDTAVVTELPFGDPAWELRYVYYSTVHWKRLVNGYSGMFPPGYKLRVAQLQHIAEDPATAWAALLDSGTTHVVVHEAALRSGQAPMIEQWLTTRGATEVGRFGSDVLYALPRPARIG